MATRVRVAVLGVGSLGQQHARIYAEMHRQEAVELVGVYDTDPAQAKAIAEKHDTTALGSIEAAAAAADALSIVTPTVTHHTLAKPLLELGKHLLVEKPMTDNAAQAAELVSLAKRHDCVLQVGHIERFNPVFNYLQQAAREPRFIESHRLSPFPARSMDIGVVLDLMIHDLDIVLAFVRSPVEHVDAAGVRVLSASEDIANARLRFSNGCVANLTVSRVSPESLRKIRVFSGGDEPGYVSLDYREQKGYHYRLARDDEQESS
ncbi:MAG: Gfo/Idh/MocA family oxidoreductase, partial [Verrucomicrobia bacterium]|nr:Gfo/Idh/MocA family oxidoreductase [Verrucomicrobiota bacterium]